MNNLANFRNMDLHEQVQAVKSLGVIAIATQEPTDKALYEHAFWYLMHTNDMQILDILDDALQAHKEGKI